MSCSFLAGEKALAAVILWASGQMDTASIAEVLEVREDAVYRTLHATRLASAPAKTEAVRR